MSATEKTKQVDDWTKAMLFRGLNLSQLCVAFRMDHRVLVEKLHGIAPSGKHYGTSTWMIHEAAPHLVRPLYDIEDYIKRMNHKDLPPMLTKEYWNGKKAKQDYEAKQGDLWNTTEVIDKVGSIFKMVSMKAKLASDNIERHTELTDRQRDAVKLIFRDMLEDLQKEIVTKFGKAVPDDQEI